MTEPKEIPVATQVIDTKTGEVLETRTTAFKLMPLTNPNVCQTCGREHQPEEPHDATSLYYQYSVFADHGCWPTWKDAVAHCAPDVARAWEAALRGMKKWSEPE